MKFKNYLNEVLNKEVPIKTRKSNEISFDTRFKAAGEEWMFFARDTTYTDDWEILFTKTNVNPLRPWDLKSDVGSKVFEVFAGVAESLKKFIKEKDPEYFHFKSSGASRTKLYKKLASLIERKSGYKHISTNISGGSTIFHFSK